MTDVEWMKYVSKQAKKIRTPSCDDSVNFRRFDKKRDIIKDDLPKHREYCKVIDIFINQYKENEDDERRKILEKRRRQGLEIKTDTYNGVDRRFGQDHLVYLFRPRR